MKATQIDLQTFLEGSKQFVLPLYQRRYSWRRKHWETLARDLKRMMDEPGRRSHFIGSFVTTPLDHAADQSVSRYRLIDGQQRLTTVLLLLAALRDLADERGRSDLAAEVHGLYLSNQFKSGEAARKLVPTEEDRADFQAAMARPSAPPPGRVCEAYEFFRDVLVELPPGRLDDARHAALSRLAVVSITLEEGDDPHLIFESLNAKGERLTQADLLRNYFLMRLPQRAADAEFARLWRPMLQELGDDLTEFFRHYLMRDADGAQVRSDEIYEHVKDRVDHDAPTPADIVEQLAEIRRHAANYARLVRPDTHEPDPSIASRVRRLHRLKVTTAYPLLLNVMEAADLGRFDAATFTAVLDLLEAFLVRRLACGVPTNQLRVIFRGLCGEAASAANGPAFLLAARAALSHNQRCPADAAFRDALVRRPIYGGSKGEVARFLLERIERSFGHLESPDPAAASVQLEHVLPQTLTDAWRGEIAAGGADPEAAHDQWLHTLGNLTLTAYNPQLSNQPFSAKRAALAESNFSLNAHFADIGHWTPEAIAARGNALADHAIGIWPDFAVPHDGGAAPGGKTRRRGVPRPVAVWIDGERHPAGSNLDATKVVLEAMLRHDPEQFERALGRTFPARRRGTTPADAATMRAPREIGPGHVVDLHGSGQWLQDRCRRLVGRMGLPPSALRFEPADGSPAP